MSLDPGALMNVYLLSKCEVRFDTYDECVVVAPDAEHARNMHPNVLAPSNWAIKKRYVDMWDDPSNVRVSLVGLADPKYKAPCVLCASFVTD